MYRLIIKGKNSSDIFALADIEYGKSRGCYTDFHLVNGAKITSSKPLAYYEKVLAEHNFYRIHHQYLVNIEHVKSLLNGIPFKIKLFSGNILPVSRLKKSDFSDLFLH
jgi:two-component system LytT family response regulator